MRSRVSSPRRARTFLMNPAGAHGGTNLSLEGINYIRQKSVVNLGPMHLTTKTHDRIPFPPVLGGLAAGGGGRLAVAGTKKN
jgi:hypothetical protein